MHDTPQDHDGAIDSQLKKLPQWHPPADFAARLAAAAARQAATAMAAPYSTPVWLWRQLLRRLPLACAAAALALVLACLTWAAVAESVVLPWLVASCVALLGLVLTVRVLRAP